MNNLASSSALGTGHYAVLGPDPRASASPAHGNAGRFQILAGRFPSDAGGFLDAPERPAKSPERHDLLLSLLVQDLAHGRHGARGSGGRQRLGRLCVVAGFQVSIDGRFWVSTEDAGFLRESPLQPGITPISSIRTGAARSAVGVHLSHAVLAEVVNHHQVIVLGRTDPTVDNRFLIR